MDVQWCNFCPAACSYCFSDRFLSLIFITLCLLNRLSSFAPAFSCVCICTLKFLPSSSKIIYWNIASVINCSMIPCCCTFGSSRFSILIQTLSREWEKMCTHTYTHKKKTVNSTSNSVEIEKWENFPILFH